MNQPPGQFKNRRATFKKNRVSVENKLLGSASDLPLFFVLASEQCIVCGLEVRARHARDCSPMGAHQHTLLFERGEIAADGGRRNF